MAQANHLNRDAQTENFATKRLQPEAIDLTGLFDSPTGPGPRGFASFGQPRAAAGLTRPQRRPRPAELPPDVEVLEVCSPPRKRQRRAPQNSAAVQAAATAAAAAAEARLGGGAAPSWGSAAAAAAAAAADESNEADVALARRLQEEEDRKLAEAEAALARRMDELEAAEAAAAAAAVAAGEGRGHAFGGGLGFGNWPFGRRRQPPPAIGAEEPAPRAAGQRSRGRRSRWAGAPSFAGAMAGMLGGGWGARAGGSNLLAHLAGAQRANLPPQLLFSDRDFTDQDYEMLLRLDETVENRKGASKETIAALGTERLRAGVGGGQGEEACDCAVCLEALKPGDTVRRLPCKHSYHKGCIDRWLQQKAACPVCQAKIG